jgi:hypothetical protein
MTTHVFIVDKTTFNIHLNYLFAGTGAKDNVVDFNGRIDSSLSANTENMLVSMIADVERVRVGDFIIFYLQQDIGQKIYEGKFFGIFKVKQCNFLDNLQHHRKELKRLRRNYSFECPKNSYKFKIQQKVALLKTALTAREEEKILTKFNLEHDRNIISSFIDKFYKGNQYLLKDLEKSLTFRILIEPYSVYSEGVTEWEALDEIKNLNSPYQMLWSLIYRKLKGNRGNTMITTYESEKLCQLIRNKNNGETLNVRKNLLCFNDDTQKIEISKNPRREYKGRKEDINVLPRLLYKFKEQKAFEVHLQAYITKNINTSFNEELDGLLLNDETLQWLGNEVSCGVGMQKIDILLSTTKKEQRTLIPIELKCASADTSNLKQIQRYIEWLRQYYIPNCPCDIQPILLTRKSKNLTDSFINSIKDFNEDNEHDCKNLKFIVFDVQSNDLHFEEVKY